MSSEDPFLLEQTENILRRVLFGTESTIGGISFENIIEKEDMSAIISMNDLGTILYPTCLTYVL